MQTFTPREYLKIDVANSFGLDKLEWHQRIAWFDANEKHLDNLIPQAKEPALFYAGIKAWRDTLAGIPTGHMISLDATSSGLQLLAALTCDILAAQLCNVVDTGKREDAYTLIYQLMLAKLNDVSKISRDDTKQAIMTAFYSSKAVPKQVFGEGALLDIFYETLAENAPHAWELNEAMLAFWNPTALEHSWVLPDNFHCHIKVMNQVRETVHFLNEPFDVYFKVNAPTKEGRSLGANTIHSVDGMVVREMTRRCDYNPHRISKLKALLEEGGPFGFSQVTQDDKLVKTLWEHYISTGYLSARILGHLKKGNAGYVDPQAILDLIASLPAKPFKLISIHDCFRCHPNYGDDLRRQYNLQLQLIAQSNLLENLISQIIGRQITVTKMEPLMPAYIGSTNYALS
jgi:hypothetical protein